MSDIVIGNNFQCSANSTIVNDIPDINKMNRLTAFVLVFIVYFVIGFVLIIVKALVRRRTKTFHEESELKNVLDSDCELITVTKIVLRPYKSVSCPPTFRR